jgi:hypothetical protein
VNAFYITCHNFSRSCCCRLYCPGQGKGTIWSFLLRKKAMFFDMASYHVSRPSEVEFDPLRLPYRGKTPPVALTSQNHNGSAATHLNPETSPFRTPKSIRHGTCSKAHRIDDRSSIPCYVACTGNVALTGESSDFVEMDVGIVAVRS